MALAGVYLAVTVWTINKQRLHECIFLACRDVDHWVSLESLLPCQRVAMVHWRYDAQGQTAGGACSHATRFAQRSVIFVAPECDVGLLSCLARSLTMIFQTSVCCPCSYDYATPSDMCTL